MINSSQLVSYHIRGENAMNPKTYMQVLRLLTTGTAIGLWAVSVNFSVEGFDFEVPDMRWMGIVLAFAVTILQLVWSKLGATANMTLMVGGLLAYCFGIWTNVIGIIQAQNLQAETGSPVRYAFPILLAVILEIMPEPMFVWGLTGLSEFGGDFLSNLFGGGGSGAGGGMPHAGGRFKGQQNNTLSKFFTGPEAINSPDRDERWAAQTVREGRVLHPTDKDIPGNIRKELGGKFTQKDNRKKSRGFF